jgi:hypothetical protein
MQFVKIDRGRLAIHAEMLGPQESNRSIVSYVEPRVYSTRETVFVVGADSLERNFAEGIVVGGEHSGSHALRRTVSPEEQRLERAKEGFQPRQRFSSGWGERRPQSVASRRNGFKEELVANQRGDRGFDVSLVE